MAVLSSYPENNKQTNKTNNLASDSYEFELEQDQITSTPSM
jgi:hypothetical protein